MEKPALLASKMIPALKIDERSNGIKRPASSLNNNCAVTPSTNTIPMMSSRTKAVVKFTYEPRLEDELGLIKGEEVCVFEKGTDGWWKGEAPNGSVGWFPSNYVEMLNSRGSNISKSIICRNVKNVSYNFSHAQVKVCEATGFRHRDPSTALMYKIAHLTHNPMAFTEIMSIVWKRLNDSGKNWRHAYKSLVLLDFLINFGDEKVAHQCRENIFTIETLKDFQHVEDSRDRGLNIREKAQQIISLLSDDERLKNERNQIILIRNKFKQNNPGPVGAESRRSNRHHISDSALEPEYKEARPSTATEEEMQLQIALALSREECRKADEMRKSDDARLQMALEESQKETDLLATTEQRTVSSEQLTQEALYDLLSLGVGELVSGNSDQSLSSGAWSNMGMADPYVSQSLTPASAQTIDGLFVPSNNDKTSTPPKNLSDMPVDVVGLIIERLDYKEQLILRKTSKSLSALVDKQKPALKRLEVSCWPDWIICKYNDQFIVYAPPTWEYDFFLSISDNRNSDTLVLTVDYEQVAFDDLASTFKNPKLQLEAFSFDSYCDGDCCVGQFEHENNRDGKTNNKHGKMESVLKSLNHQPSVKACEVTPLSFRSDLPIISFLKPKVLEKITIVSHPYDKWRKYSKEMEQIARLDQWKQAKELEVHDLLDKKFPVKHVTHFKRLHFELEFLTPKYFAPIRNLILEPGNIEFCTIVIDKDSSWCLEEFNDTLGTLVSPNLYHYTTPDSEYYLELLFSGNCFTIEKKKK